MPEEMESFLTSIDIYPQLYWLKSSIQFSISLFKSGYFPLSSQNERDIRNQAWSFISSDFHNSIITCRTESTSKSCKLSRNKKRKRASSAPAEPLSPGLIPDMLISFTHMELAIVEVARKSDDTKEFVEGGDKRPKMMKQILGRLVDECPDLKRSLSVYGLLLSELKCTPMQLKVPFGEVKLLVTGSPLQYPEYHLMFTVGLFPVLRQV
ncbi:hypothetical protein MBANPS3_002311 [Mucor bainieri]